MSKSYEVFAYGGQSYGVYQATTETAAVVAMLRDGGVDEVEIDKKLDYYYAEDVSAKLLAASIEEACGAGVTAAPLQPLGEDGRVLVRVTVRASEVDDSTGTSDAGTRVWDWLQEQGHVVTDNSGDSQTYLQPGIGLRYDHVYIVEPKCDPAERMVMFNGRAINLQAMRQLMDDEICEEIHGTVESEQEFVDAYLKAHEAKYGTPFIFG